MKIKKLIILLFFLLLAPFEAVLSKKNPVIDKIELFTEGQVDKKTLERNLVLMIGKPVYSDDYYRAIQEATSSGDIGGMEIKVSQDFLGFYVARIHVKPVPILSEIILEGNWPISPNQVLNQLRIKENQSFWENRIKERKPILQEYLGKIGYPENQVSYTLKEIKKNHFNLFLKLNIGRACTIKTVNLIGKSTKKVKKQILKLIKLKPGSLCRMEFMEEDTKNIRNFLFQNGYFESILGDLKLMGSKFSLNYQIPLKLGKKYHIKILGNRFIRKDFIKKMMLENLNRLGISRSVLKTIKDDIIKIYFKAGFAKVKLKIKKEISKNGKKIYLKVLIHEGKQWTVSGITVFGTRYFKDNFLSQEVNGWITRYFFSEDILQNIHFRETDRLKQLRPKQKPISFMILPPEKIFVPSLYENIQQNIVNLYHQHGFMMAKVVYSEPYFNKKTREIFLKYRVIEGPQYKYQKISFKGFPKSQFDSQIFEGSPVLANNPFNQRPAKELKNKMEEYLRAQGFYYSKVLDQYKTDYFTHKVELTFKIDPGPKVRIGEIVILDNTQVKDQVLRSRINAESGDLITPKLINNIQEDLLSLQIISDARIKLSNEELPDVTKDILIFIREREPRSIVLKSGYSDAKGPRVSMEFIHRNLKNQLLELKLSNKFNLPKEDDIPEGLKGRRFWYQVERDIGLFLSYPNKFPWVRMIWGKFRVNHKREFRPEILESYLIGQGIEFKVTKHLNIKLNIDLEFNRFPYRESSSNFDDLDMSQLSETEKFNLKLKKIRQDKENPEGIFSSVNQALKLDFKDNPFFPTRGWVLELKGDLVKSLVVKKDPSYFYLTHGVFNFYIPILSKLTFANSFQMGYIFHLLKNSKTTARKKFLMGGRGSLRGHQESSILTLEEEELQEERCQTLEERDLCFRSRSDHFLTIGGDISLLNKSESRYAFSDSFTVALFFEMGHLFEKPENINPLKLRKTAGFGVRYKLPIGAMSFDFGFKLDRKRFEPKDDNWAFHFSIGQF